MRTLRFSIRRLMLLVAAVAWFSWLGVSILRLQGFGIAMAYFTLLAGLAIGPWSATRGRRRVAGWTFAASAAVECVSMATMGVIAINSYLTVIKMMISMTLLPIAAGSGVAWAGLATAPGGGRRVPRAATWSLVALMLFLPASMMFSRWPIRAAFLASRPALDRLADRIAAGGTLSRPEWAGLFLVRKAHRTVGSPAFVGLVVEHHVWMVRTDSAEVEPKVPSPTYTNDSLGDDGRWWLAEYF